MIPSELRKALGHDLGGMFYLHGPDEHRKEAAARALIEAHLVPGTRDFNYDVVRGSEVDVEHLASVLGTPPMMAEWRVVVLREAQALASSPRVRALLLETATSPPPGLALILLSTPKSKARFYTDLERLGRSLEFPVPDPNDLPAWLMEWSQGSFGRPLDEDAARLLAQAVGANLSILARELEKLATLVGDGGRITRETVEAAGTSVPRQDRWEWFDFVGEARFGEALRGLPILLEHGETGVGLTMGLGTHLLRVGLALEGGAHALEAVLPGRQRWLARRYVNQARRWTSADLRAALDGLLVVDQLLKSSGLSGEHLLETWLLGQMARVTEAA